MASSFIIELVNEEVKLPLPTLTECDLIQNNRDETPKPESARSHSHLKAIADKIPPLDHRTEILLLLG